MTRSCRDFPHRLLVPKMHGHQAEADVWCTEHFGKRWSVIDNREGVWCCFWRGRSMPGAYEWYFENEQDMVLFMLRWM